LRNIANRRRRRRLCWSADISKEDALARLLDLTRERAAGGSRG
jgi:hypothetical protein